MVAWVKHFFPIFSINVGQINFFYVSLAAALKAGHSGVGLQLHIAEKIILGHSLVKNDPVLFFRLTSYVQHSFSC